MQFRGLYKKIRGRISHEFRKFKVPYARSYSQCGEDMIAKFYLHQQKGFYVDVGAYHPKRLSNTNYFYQKGWNGINIDGSLESIKLFDKHRPRDININCCVGKADMNKDIEFFIFKSGELNTFKKEALPDIKLYQGQSPIESRKVSVRSLAAILDEHLPPGTPVDLLTIDAEGADEEILLSNNWEKYRPLLIIVEKHCTIYDFINSEMHHLLSTKNYLLGGYSRHSYIFHEANYSTF